MHVDCGTCPVRHTHCSDCMVTAMLSASPAPPAGAPLPLDGRERQAVASLVATGLIAPADARVLHAEREVWTAALVG